MSANDDNARAAAAGFTPGPWDAAYGTEGYYYITHNDGLDLCDEDGANACLIAAAPDLLKALENVVTNWASLGGHTWPWLIEARAAIAKARGES